MTGTNITDSAVNSLEQGIDAADTPDRAAEVKFVQKLAKRVKEAREFDENAHRQYAVDRAYARGDSGFDVDGNMVGTFIDILKSFIYAKNPEVDILPALSAEPPSMDALRDAAEMMAQPAPDAQAIKAQAAMLVSQGIPQDLALQQAMGGAGLSPEAQAQAAMAVLQGVPEQMALEQALVAAREAEVQAQFKQLQDRYQKRQRDNKAFADTLEIVVSKLWADAKLKIRGQAVAGSALTIGPGWLKGSWQERMQDDPAIRKQINDIQSHYARAKALQEEFDEGEVDDQEATAEDLRLQMEQLESSVKQVIARGFVVDFIPAEYMTVAPGVDLANAEDAPWIDEIIPKRADEAKAEYGLTAEQIGRATKFSEAKPIMRKNITPIAGEENMTAKDANRFTSSNDGEASTGDWVMVHETWDIERGKFFTWIEGISGYVAPPAEPTPTQRFYPYFCLCIGTVDGQRHPQSLVSRSHKLIDEYYRIKSAEREHRKRIKPKILFLEGQIDSESVKKVTSGVTGEFVGIKPLNPKADIRSIFAPATYPQLDPALYDTSRVMSDIERIFGVQEALSGAINTAKTATEAQIQQTGMQSRTGSMRDALEDLLSSLAFYTAECSRKHMDIEDVQAIVGPDAMWPEYKEGEDVGAMLNVSIRAGSTGKPNTTAERASWAALLPILQAGVMQVGQMRGATPADMSDALAEILGITLKRNDERIDLSALLPQAGPAPMQPPGMPLPLGAGPAGAVPADPITNPIG